MPCSAKVFPDCVSNGSWNFSAWRNIPCDVQKSWKWSFKIALLKRFLANLYRATGNFSYNKLYNDWALEDGMNRACYFEKCGINRTILLLQNLKDASTYRRASPLRKLSSLIDAPTSGHPNMPSVASTCKFKDKHICGYSNPATCFR